MRTPSWVPTPSPTTPATRSMAANAACPRSARRRRGRSASTAAPRSAGRCRPPMAATVWSPTPSSGLERPTPRPRCPVAWRSPGRGASWRRPARPPASFTRPTAPRATPATPWWRRTWTATAPPWNSFSRSAARSPSATPPGRRWRSARAISSSSSCRPRKAATGGWTTPWAPRRRFRTGSGSCAYAEDRTPSSPAPSGARRAGRIRAPPIRSPPRTATATRRPWTSPSR